MKRVAKIFETQNFQLVLKPHPEDKEPYTKEFIEAAKVELWSERFEAVFMSADILLFDFISSPFYAALHSSKPIIFIDLGLNKIDKAFRKYFDKRIVTVQATCNENNEYTVEEQDLLNAISLAYERCNDLLAVKALYHEG